MVLTWATLTPGRFFRIVLAACTLLLLVTYYSVYHSDFLSRLTSAHSAPIHVFPPVTTSGNETVTIPAPSGEHPIEQLIRAADREFEELTEDVAQTLAEAAENYRARRGRHPPPGFDSWFKLARKTNALVTESLFDQIYHDLEPFWGAKPAELRDFAKRWPNVITVRRRDVQLRTSNQGIAFGNRWLITWQEMVQAMPDLPDVDLPMRVGDEPRVMVPFKRINEYMARAEYQRRKHRLVPVDRIRNKMPTYPKLKGSPPDDEPGRDLSSIAPREYWDFVLDACKPEDPVFTDTERQLNSSIPPVFSKNYTTGTFMGFVSNSTMSKNVCYNPNLRSLHGHMISPHLLSVYTDLHPLFGVAKLVGVSNDILVPTPDHWYASDYAGMKTTVPWRRKKAAAVWRGTATGGQHTETNWWGFQRHRFVAMTNKTTVGFVEHEMEPLDEPSYSLLEAVHRGSFDWGMNNIAFPNQHIFNITAQTYGKLGQWAGEVADGGFTHFYCDPWRLMMAEADDCNYTSPYYSLKPKLNTSEVLHYKYLPDIDGQSSSGRFRGFLESLSVPIKASIFREWRDSRLVPWRHFVPMSNEFQEWWGLMEYFVGYRGLPNETTVEGHDEVGERIGRLGSKWVHRVERKEDMLLYFYRVVLEYARICADQRIELGFTDDIPRS